MRSRTDRRPRPLAAAIVATILLCPCLAAADEPRPLATDAEVARAIEKVMADPNLGGQRTIKTLDWIANPEPKRTGTPAWLKWIAGLFRWLDQSARLLLYLAVIALVAWLAYLIVRFAGQRRAADGSETIFVAPTHVRDLDIRPETLPADIGGAARRLWDRGDRRACLALLYRGLLSRLAHVHRVPIRDSTTEGDCLELAARSLPLHRQAYAGRLVSAWQRFVYGHEEGDATAVYALCDEFAAAIDPPPASRPAGGPS